MKIEEGGNLVGESYPYEALTFKLECVVGSDYITIVIATSYRYIVQKAGVRSGLPIIKGTRIGVHDVVAMTKMGASVAEVVASFPG